MESPEQKLSREGGSNMERALENERGLLEQFRKHAGPKTRALALAFLVLSSEGCSGLAYYGLDPIDRIQRSGFETSPYKARRLGPTTWELRRGEEVVYTLTMPRTNKKSLVLEGPGFQESISLPRPRNKDCAIRVKVFGAQFIVRETDPRLRLSPMEIVADGYAQWDPATKPIESFTVCP